MCGSRPSANPAIITDEGSASPPSDRSCAAATSPAPRADEWRPYLDVADLLAQAPQLDERYIVVPDIPHTTLE